MRTEYAYEILAAVFLVMVLICYKKKNWLDLRANRVFYVVLCMQVVLTLLDVFTRWISALLGDGYLGVKYILGMLGCLSLVLSFAAIYVYFLTLVGRIERLMSRTYVLMMLPASIANLLIITSPWHGLVYYYTADGIYHNGPLGWVVMLSACLYAVGVCILCFVGRDVIPRRDALICSLICVFNVVLAVVQQVVFHNRYLLLFFAQDFMVVCLYLFFQNMDRFADRISGGFSRAGYRKVLNEKFRYQERFGCLFVTIQNYQNITSICEEQEIYKIMGEIGAILRRCGGVHNQFHIHGADFAVIQKRETELVKTYFRASAELPKMIRVSGRNIPITYGFYILTLEEAAYDQSEFYKMSSSMKKMLKEQTDSSKLLRYEGEVQRTIDMELYIGRKLKAILNERACDLVFYPVIDAKTEKCHALEAQIYMTRENGKIIPEDAVWAVAKEMGFMKELGYLVLDGMLECATRENLLERGVRKMAINISPLHLSSSGCLKDCVELTQKYQYPIDKLCLELTEDMSISHEAMQDRLKELKDLGISLILDRYGESVCNLRQIMQMPFNTVKISSQMVKRYCAEESDILKYQIQMMENNGWTICLDGIDNAVRKEKVDELGVTFFQGDYFSRPITSDRLHAYMEGLG